jgi:hypothetical protein
MTRILGYLAYLVCHLLIIIHQLLFQLFMAFYPDQPPFQYTYIFVSRSNSYFIGLKL